jgi:hypothetical protein
MRVKRMTSIGSPVMPMSMPMMRPTANIMGSARGLKRGMTWA